MSSAVGGQAINVFLSYASADQNRALAIADALAAAGVSVWIDRRGIAGGTAWAGEIVAAVRACNVVAVLCSTASMRSRNVRQELQLAWDCDRPILPLLLERVDFPDSVAYFLQGQQWVEILDRPNDAWTKDVLEALAGSYARHNSPTTQAAPSVVQTETVGTATLPDVTLLGNLPAPPTPIVGRTDDVATVTNMLLQGEARLVTLSGPGGVGKTRLAIEVASKVGHGFPDGIWYTDLTPVRDIGLVIPSIARVLDVREEGDRPLRDRLVSFFQGKRLLLLLDNFEQITTAGPAIADLLAAAPGLTVLATSRTPLRLRAEREIAVAPLALPSVGRQVSVATLLQVPAVALFQERAAAARAGFAVTSDNAVAVAEICRRLDGLPLAIELAAARVRMLPPSALLARLDDRLKVLAGGALDLPERQRTMRDAIAWSYDLLEPAEQQLFRRLSVFAAAFDLETAEAVVSSAIDDDTDLDVLDGLARLVDHSLLRQLETADGELRFAMLATIREYGLAQLADSADAIDAHQRHARFFLDLAERSAPQLTGADQYIWLQRLEDAHEDLRASMDWSATHDPTGMLRIAAALWRFWFIRGYVSEGREWLNRALSGAAGVDPAVRANALDAASGLAWANGDLDRALTLGEECLAVYRELGDPSGIATALNAVGAVIADGGDTERARAIFEEELAIRRTLDNPRGLALVLSNLAEIMRYGDDFLTDVSGAGARFEEALALLRGVGDEAIVAHVTRQLAMIATAEGDIDRARTLLADTLAASQRLGDRRGVAAVLACVAEVAAVRNRPERAARLLGGESALREAIGAPVTPGEIVWYERLKSTVRAALGDAEYAAACDIGSQLPLEDIVAEASLEAQQAE